MTGIESDATIADALREQAAPGTGPGAGERSPSQPGEAGERAPAGESPQTIGQEPAQASGAAPGLESEALDGDVQELVAVAAQRDEYLALAQRTQADFENYRKRVARDAAAAGERSVIKLARELLPAIDNLDRALAEAGAAEGEEDGAQEQGDPLRDGVRLVRSELGGALGRVGIEEFSPLGEVFDPTRHEAMAQRPALEQETAGTVVEVYQSGYRLGESIIRPARVLVAS